MAPWLRPAVLRGQAKNEPFIFGVKLLINKNPIIQILPIRRVSTYSQQSNNLKIVGLLC